MGSIWKKDKLNQDQIIVLLDNSMVETVEGPGINGSSEEVFGISETEPDPENGFPEGYRISGVEVEEFLHRQAETYPLYIELGGILDGDSSEGIREYELSVSFTRNETVLEDIIDRKDWDLLADSSVGEHLMQGIDRFCSDDVIYQIADWRSRGIKPVDSWHISAVTKDEIYDQVVGEKSYA